MDSLEAVSWGDALDYAACPKIVALRVSNGTTADGGPGPPGRGPRDEMRRGPRDAGGIPSYPAGEEIPGPYPKPRPVSAYLAWHMRSLRSHLRAVGECVREDMGEAARGLGDGYGRLASVGRGELVSGILPCRARPDVLAATGGGGLVAAFAVRSRRADMGAYGFAASYCALAGEGGTAVLEERLEGGEPAFGPRATGPAGARAVLLRGGGRREAGGAAGLPEGTVRGIWEAKQLGLSGRSPETGCGASCPCRAHGSLPAGSLEPAPPLPLIFARGLVESGVDLNRSYLHDYLWYVGAVRPVRAGVEGARHVQYYARASKAAYARGRVKSIERAKDRFFEEAAGLLGVTNREMRKAERGFTDVLGRASKAAAAMASELEPWWALVRARGGEKGRKRAIWELTSSAAFAAARAYRLPRGSAEFVGRSWDYWK